MSKRLRRNRLGVYGFGCGRAGEIAGRKKVVIGVAARTWSIGRSGYMKRTSLWEIRERTVVTRRAVVASWYFTVLVCGDELVYVGG